MKKTLPILAFLALIAGACTNPLETGFYQAPEVIILNAMLRTDDTVHFALVSRGLTDDVLPAPDALLRCFVNGTPVSEGTYSPGNSYTYASRFDFPARIQPGDEVRLEAVDGSLRASATVTAPEAASIVAVDTAYVKDSPYYTPEAMRCRLRIQDLPGQDNWYRLVVMNEKSRTDSLHLYDYSQQRFVNFGFMEDPILQDGYSKDSDKGNNITQLFAGIGLPNAYCSFKDVSFADSSAEVEIHLKDPGNSAYYVANDYDMRTHSMVPNRIILTSSLKFTLLTITKEEYDYLTQLNKSLHSSLDLGTLQEPIHIPGNVEGGHGFVSVASASTLVLTMPLGEGNPYIFF